MNVLIQKNPPGQHNQVGSFNPFEKYACQIGSFPQIGVKIKNIWNHHLVMAKWFY